MLDPQQRFQRRAGVARFLAAVLTMVLVAVMGLALLQGLRKAYPCFWLPGQCTEQGGYALEYFDGLTAIAAPMESRRWSDGGNLVTNSGFDCSFAIASLDGRAPDIPPARRKTDEPDMAWGGGWRAVTTLPTQDRVDLRSLLAICGVYWSDSTVGALARAVADRRTLVSGRAPYREINVYLPPADLPGLAARIRFGE